MRKKDRYGNVVQMGTETVRGEILKDDDLERLIALKDVEEELANALLVKFESIEGIKNASAEELEEIPGIGDKRAKSIIKQLKG